MTPLPSSGVTAGTLGPQRRDPGVRVPLPATFSDRLLNVLRIGEPGVRWTARQRERSAAAATLSLPASVECGFRTPPTFLGAGISSSDRPPHRDRLRTSVTHVRIADVEAGRIPSRWAPTCGGSVERRAASVADGRSRRSLFTDFPARQPRDPLASFFSAGEQFSIDSSRTDPNRAFKDISFRRLQSRLASGPTAGVRPPNFPSTEENNQSAVSISRPELEYLGRGATAAAVSSPFNRSASRHRRAVTDRPWPDGSRCRFEQSDTRLPDAGLAVLRPCQRTLDTRSALRLAPDLESSPSPDAERRPVSGRLWPWTAISDPGTAAL